MPWNVVSGMYELDPACDPADCSCNMCWEDRDALGRVWYVYLTFALGCWTIVTLASCVLLSRQWKHTQRRATLLLVLGLALVSIMNTVGGNIFLVPFYYIEYGIAQLGALGVWKNSKSDRAQALTDYKRALALGGSRPLPELFAAANIPFRFDTEAFEPLVELIQSELAALK